MNNSLYFKKKFSQAEAKQYPLVRLKAKPNQRCVYQWLTSYKLEFLGGFSNSTYVQKKQTEQTLRGRMVSGMPKSYLLRSIKLGVRLKQLAIVNKHSHYFFLASYGYKKLGIIFNNNLVKSLYISFCSEANLMFLFFKTAFLKVGERS